MPRIISIEEGKLLDAYKATGLSPDEIEALYAKTADTEPPLPPLYIRATPEAKAAEEALIGDIASVLAERMKTYVEGNRKAEAKKKAAKKPPRKEEVEIDDEALEARFKAMLEEYKAQTSK